MFFNPLEEGEGDLDEIKNKISEINQNMKDSHLL